MNMNFSVSEQHFVLQISHSEIRNVSIFKICVGISVFRRKKLDIKILYLVAWILSKTPVSLFLGHPVCMAVSS